MVMIRRTLMQKVVADESVARCLVYCHTTDALQFEYFSRQGLFLKKLDDSIRVGFCLHIVGKKWISEISCDELQQAVAGV